MISTGYIWIFSEIPRFSICNSKISLEFHSNGLMCIYSYDPYLALPWRKYKFLQNILKTVADPGATGPCPPPISHGRSLFHVIFQALWLQSKQIFSSYNFLYAFSRIMKWNSSSVNLSDPIMVILLACQQQQPPCKIVLVSFPKHILSVNYEFWRSSHSATTGGSFFQDWEDPHVASYNDGWGTTGGTFSAVHRDRTLSISSLIRGRPQRTSAKNRPFWPPPLSASVRMRPTPPPSNLTV